MNISGFALFAASLLLVLRAAGAQGDDNGMDINISAGIDDAEKAKRDHDPAYAQDETQRKRLYFLARIREEKHGLDLVKPVDEVALAKHLEQVLEKQGFHAVKPGQIPDILITVKYGIGIPPNPYRYERLVGPNNLSNTPPVVTWETHDSYVGLEEKSARVHSKGDSGKLAIEIRAWEYPLPKDPKQWEKLLWKTTVWVDDPDHRDLNGISLKMLAAAAPYFDHHIGREHEVVINSQTPEGHVKVGTPELVPESK